MVKKTKPKKSKKKNAQIKNNDEPTELVQAPHTFVIHRGLSCPYIADLTKDFRRIMEPFTAMHLKERKSNKIKDFISLSGHFHVSHMCIFNKATTQLSFKILRLPRGPTLTFKVHQFMLSRDIISSTKKQYVDEEIFHTPPLVVMNNFSGEGKHLKLMANTFQNMYPSINLATISLSNVRRCILFSYNALTKLVELRHYSIIVVPVGLSRGVKKVVLGRIPNLAKCNDICDYFDQVGASESEFEDDEANQIILPQTLKQKGNLENNKSSVRLHEIGPRISFELVKIEDGLLTGEVLYHETVIKTEEEVEKIQKMREKKKKIKELRKKVQNQNKLKNDEKKNKPKNKKDLGKKQKQEIPREKVEADDDAQYYKDEVGEEPDEELFKSSDNNATKRVKLPKYMNVKKRKLDNDKKQTKEKSFKDKKFKSPGKPFKKNNRDGQDEKAFKKPHNKGKLGFKTKSKPGLKVKSSSTFKKKFKSRK